MARIIERNKDTGTCIIKTNVGYAVHQIEGTITRVKAAGLTTLALARVAAGIAYNPPTVQHKTREQHQAEQRAAKQSKGK